MRRHPNVINIDELEVAVRPGTRPSPFGGASKRLGFETGASQLGAGYFIVPEGKTAVPIHAHHSNEEAIFIHEGRGTLRIGKDRLLVRAGDWISLPVGEAYAHQLLADQGTELAYLCISTMHPVEVVTYPDSNKLLASVSHPAAPLRKIFHAEAGNVDYFEGEGDKR
jgi:uncharacterized cupin superfamily protein